MDNSCLKCLICDDEFDEDNGFEWHLQGVDALCLCAACAASILYRTAGKPGVWKYVVGAVRDLGSEYAYSQEMERERVIGIMVKSPYNNV